MPLPVDWGKVEEALKLIEAGKESYGSAGKRLGVGKTTLYRWHVKKLKKELEEAKGELAAFERKREKLQADLEGLEERYRRKNEELQKEHEERKQRLKAEIDALIQQREMVKEAFERMGVTWEQGVQIVKDVGDLRGETSKLQRDLTRLRREVSRWEERAKKARSSFLQLEMQLSNLRGAVREKEAELSYLTNQAISAAGKLYAIEAEKRRLSETVKAFKEIIFVHELEDRKASLQAEVDRLTERLWKLAEELEQLRVNKETLTEEIKRLKAEMDKLKSERDRLMLERKERIKEAKEVAERIVADAEQERKRLLAGVEEERGRILQSLRLLRGEIQRARAEKALVEAALRIGVEKLRDVGLDMEGLSIKMQDRGTLPKIPL